MSITLTALALFPEQLKHYFYSIPESYRNWSPSSWEGIPSEKFTGIEHICHVRDIEIDGYQVRFRRLLEEQNPTLDSIDGCILANQRNYTNAIAESVLDDFKKARLQTLDMIHNFGKSQLNRIGYFEGYGQLSVQGLIHYLCSHDQQHLSGLQWLLGQIESNFSEK